MQLEKPDLYAVSEDGSSLRLLATRCTQCHGLSFPAARYGCPLCGADLGAGTQEVLDGRARLLSFLTIHSSLGRGLEAPLVVGEAEIAGGIIEEIMLGVPEAALTDGMIVQAVPVAVERNGTAVIACRFVPAEAAP